MNITNITTTNFGHRGHGTQKQAAETAKKLYYERKQSLIEIIRSNIAQIEAERNMYILGYSRRVIDNFYFKKLYSIDETLENLRNNLAILTSLKK